MKTRGMQSSLENLLVLSSGPVLLRRESEDPRQTYMCGGTDRAAFARYMGEQVAEGEYQEIIFMVSYM